MEVRSTQPQEILSSNEYIENQKIEYQKMSFLNALEKDTQPVLTCEICSKLTIKTPEQRQRLILVSFLLTLNIFHNLL